MCVQWQGNVHSQVFLPSLEKVQGMPLFVPAAVGGWQGVTAVPLHGTNTCSDLELHSWMCMEAVLCVSIVLDRMRGKDHLATLWVILLYLVFIFTVVSELSGCSCTVVPSIVSWMKGYAEYVAFPLFFSVFWSPLVFRKTLLCLLVLGITMALHRWDIQEAQSKFILSTTVSGMLEKCDMACHVNRKQPL